jgi:hypothetical protein
MGRPDPHVARERNVNRNKKGPAKGEANPYPGNETRMQMMNNSDVPTHTTKFTTGSVRRLLYEPRFAYLSGVAMSLLALTVGQVVR